MNHSPDQGYPTLDLITKTDMNEPLASTYFSNRGIVCSLWLFMDNCVYTGNYGEKIRTQFCQGRVH